MTEKNALLRNLEESPVSRPSRVRSRSCARAS